MNYKDTEQLAMRAVQGYYEGDTTLFFQCLHSDVVILSVGKGQLLEGKESVMEHFTHSAQSQVKNRISSMTCKAYPIAKGQCYCVLQMDITTIYPDGHMAKVNQRMTVIWSYRESWLIRHLNISISMQMDYTQVRVSHISEDFMTEIMAQERMEKKVCLKAADGGKYYVQISSIIRLEAGRNCTHVYTAEQELIVKKTLKDVLEEIQDGTILRVHQSHAVNVWQVLSVNNYKAGLKDGSTIPISREHYAETKDRILKLLQNKITAE